MAEEQLHERAISGAVTKGHIGLGFFPTIRVDKFSDKGKRWLIQNEVHKGDGGNRLTKIVVLKQQRVWTSWNSTINGKSNGQKYRTIM